MFLILIALLPISHAQTQPQDPYKDENFLRTSDATTWDISKIPWGNPIVYNNPSLYNRKDIYSTASVYTYRDFYNFLPDDKYKLLDYKRVNYDLISDHNKIDSSKYLKDLGCASCSFDKRGQNVKFSGNGITHPNGDYVSIPGNYPAGTLFIATKDRIEVRIPKTTSTINIPNDNDVTVNTQGAEITLPDGMKFNGKLSYQNGQAYVKAGDVITVERVEIQPVKGDSIENVLLFSDGEKHQDITSDYVSLNSQGKKMFVHGNEKTGTFNLNFKKDNTFLKIEDGDEGKFHIYKNINMRIQNRDEQGLIPSIKVGLTKDDGVFRIVSGSANIFVNEKEITALTLSGISTSSPMSIVAEDKSGNSMIGTVKEPKKILVSNFNEIATIPLTVQEHIIQTSESYDYAPSKVSERLYYNYDAYTLENFRKEFPNIGLSGRTDSYTIKRISDTLNHLPPKVKDSIKGFEIFTPEEWRARNLKIYGQEDTADASTGTDRIIRLNTGHLEESTIYHEAAHDRIFVIASEYSRASNQDSYKLAQDRYERAKRNFGDNSIIPKLLGIKDVRPSFESQWKSVSGDAYGKDLAKRDGTTSWSDGTYGPKNSCVRTYGCTNYEDDVATFVENVNKNPSFYKPLITPGSPQYDQRYKKKLDLLYQNGFITKERYDLVVGDKK